MEQEIWKDIPDYEGIYQASNLGRIRTHENKTTSSALYKERHWKQRIMKPKCCKCSKHHKRLDARVELWKGGKHKTHLVARLVASAFYGKSNLTVNHIDGNSMNNQITNLEYVSLAGNIRKGFETGLYTTQVATIIINKKTQEVKKFRSMSQASLYMKKSIGYIDCNIKRKKYENNDFIWKVDYE